MTEENKNRAASWVETTVALGPILLFLLLYIIGALITVFLGDLENPALGSAILIPMAATLLAALTAGWVKNFPRWVFPYWGFVFLITLYFYSFSGTLFALPFTGGLSVWFPLVIVMLIGLLWTRSLRPLWVLARSIWRDWTLLSFAFYGTLPLLSFAAYDETRNQAGMHVLILLILGIGTVFYMRLENPWHRFASLVGGFSVSWLTLMINLGWYWNGRQEYWMPEPGSWVRTFSWTSRFGAFLMFILVAPVVIELIRSVVNPKAGSPSSQASQEN